MRLEGISMDFRKILSLLATVTVTGYFVLPQQPAIAAEAMATGPRAAAVRPDSAVEESASRLTLGRALALALKYNAGLSAFSQELRASEAAILQAGVLPNPVLELTGENLDNARLRQDGDRTTGIQIGQLIELGGKRSARVRIAETGRDLANWDYEAKRIDVLLQVSQYFIDTVAAQESLLLTGESLKLARDVADAVAKRVLAGKVSPIEETKAKLALAAAQIDAEQARRQLAAARKNLASMWGNPEPLFESATADLESIQPLPGYEQLTARVRNNPDLARWNTEIARRQAAIDAEKAKAIPDITVSVGRRRFSQFEDHAYMLGVSIPIPLFDRNRGGIVETHRRLDKAMDEQRAAEDRLLAEFSRGFQRLSGIRAEIETLRNSMLPGARSAYDGATKGYQLGKFGILDVLDAQRTLFQTRTQYLKALADYHRGSNEIERLIGGPLSGATPVAAKP